MYGRFVCTINHMHAVPAEPSRGHQNSPETGVNRWLWAALLVLGTDAPVLWNSGQVLNHWTVSPIPDWFWTCNLFTFVPGGWDYRHASPCTTLIFFFFFEGEGKGGTGIQNRSFCLLGKCSASESDPQWIILFWLFSLNYCNFCLLLMYKCDKLHLQISLYWSMLVSISRLNLPFHVLLSFIC